MTTTEFNSTLIGMRTILMRFALSLTGDREKAPDLLHDTYLKALLNKDKIEDFTNIKAWVFTIMKNNFINNYRRNVKENSIFDVTKELQNLNQPLCMDFASTESNFSENEIEKAIDSLRQEFRIPFRMHVEGYKYEEIASELGLKIGTVKSRIFLSRKKLMSMLKDYDS